jgi:branched-chain amino acid transport system substrate-binding protein
MLALDAPELTQVYERRAMNKIRMWAMIFFALGCLANCATRPQQPAETKPTPKLSTATPAQAETLWQQAEKAQKAGNLPAAIASWERIIQTYPDYAIAAKSYYTLGGIYLGQGQPEKALQYYDYLIYAYPGWEGIGLAKLDRMRAWSMTGKNKQVTKEAVPLWEASSGHPEVQVGLSTLMAGVYGSERDMSTGFDWLTAGFGVARTPEQKKTLTQATVNFLNGADAKTVQRLLKKNPPDFMKVFLYYRLTQSDSEKGQSDAARQSLHELLARTPSHPLVQEMQGAGKGPSAPVPATVPGPPEVATAVNPDRVGCLAPLNGPYAKYGDMVIKGLNLASEDWNEAHPNQPVTVVVKEAQADPDLATQSLEKLVKEDGVMAVIGPLGSQTAKAVTPMANKLGVPLLTLTQQDEQAEGSRYVVHVFLDNRELVRTLVSYCKDRLGAARFAVLYPDDRYGQNLTKIFSEVVKEAGGNLLASVSYKDKSTDFREPIEKLLNIAKKNSPPTGVETTPFDILFIPDQVQTVALIAPQLPYNNVVGVMLLGTNLWGEAPLVQAGGVYVERALFATPFMLDSQNRTVKAFRERFEAKYNAPPSYLEAQAYDALMLFLDARNGSNGDVKDRASLLRNLLQIRDFEGIAGTYSFNQQGQLDRNYMLFQVVNGQLVQLNH